jgi:hypothetical protein
MKNVKPTTVHRMKVVPHRPIKTMINRAMILLLIIGIVFVVREYTIFDERKTLLSPEQANNLRAEMEGLRTANQAFQEQLTHYQVTSDVDHQATESVRKQVLQQQEKIGELERSVAVYRMMLARDYRNPRGINIGAFSVATGEQENLFHLKLAIQKLSEGEGDFEGELRWLIVGREAGKEKKYSLHQLAAIKENESVLTEIIPLSFKIFQNIEADVVLPQGFVPNRIELQVTSPKRDATRVDGQVEWPKAPPTSTSNT